MISIPHEISIYQPLPFDEYKNATPSRLDCAERYEVIRYHMEDGIKNNDLLDVGCANGYFCFRFLQDGGSGVTGVEIDTKTAEFVEELAKSKDMNFKVYKDFNDEALNSKIHRYAFYLDTHFHEGTKGYLERLKNLAKTAFISPSGMNGKYNESLRLHLKELYSSVESIYTGFENRTIFKCE